MFMRVRRSLLIMSVSRGLLVLVRVHMGVRVAVHGIPVPMFVRMGVAVLVAVTVAHPVFSWLMAPEHRGRSIRVNATNSTSVAWPGCPSVAGRRPPVIHAVSASVATALISASVQNCSRPKTRVGS